jgi:fatty acid desaturase
MRNIPPVLQTIIASRNASWLTHASLALLFAAEFTLILRCPFVVMLIPSILIHHRIGILLHEYMHGIPFRRYRNNLRLLTIANSFLLTFGFQEIFRGTHLEHHRWLNTARDPGFHLPSRGGPRSTLLRPLWIFYRTFAGDHGLALYLKHLRSLTRGGHPYVKPRRVAVEAALSILVLLGWVALGEYRVPLALIALHLCIWPPAAFRGTLEHSSSPDDPNFANEYRVRIPMFNMNRHIHHHIDPTCPWYRLEFKTANPRPPHVYWTHWYHVFVKRDYVFMQPMPRVNQQRERG